MSSHAVLTVLSEPHYTAMPYIPTTNQLVDFTADAAVVGSGSSLSSAIPQPIVLAATATVNQPPVQSKREGLHT